MKGTVLRSINNIYSVRSEDGNNYSCRIKGKQLSVAKGEYNPIVVGDIVEFTPSGTSEGLVTSRLDRKSASALGSQQKDDDGQHHALRRQGLRGTARIGTKSR